MRELVAILLLLACSIHLPAQSECEKKAFFSPMPNHEETGCEIKEFDSHTFRSSSADGRTEDVVVEGEKSTVRYNWLGDWEKRPSSVQIYRNYQAAIEKQGGELLYTGSSAYYRWKKSGDIFYFEVLSDGSGMYSVITVRETSMNQDVVFTASEIERIVSQEGQITFYGIYFDANKSTLKTESAGALKEIAAYLKANPSKNVYLVGHTDNTGVHEHNLNLSRERAQTVVSELINVYSVSASHISGEGVGELCPVASNGTEEGRAKNRRVVMVLKK